jgi:cytochrome c oxidase assembly protein subunit 11
MSTTPANRRLAGRILLVSAAMFGFGFALVPLYDVFCRVTGLNGKTGGPVAAEVAFQPDQKRIVWVEFLANVNTQAPWTFRPQVIRMAVHPGAFYTTRYRARNPTSATHTVQAVPSVAPGLAARYLKKSECFCFRQQSFASHEERELPLRFALDPALPPEVETLSLAYTLFDAPGA